jgi:ATP-dependent helicase/nuclease subunit B
VTERARPRIYSIAAHRGFADALVAGLLPRYKQDDIGLARLTLLLPSRRAIRTIAEAFIRLAGDLGAGGLLMPRMVAVGDLDLDEALGPLLDPIGAGNHIPPAVDPTRRWLRIAEILRAEMGADAPRGSALLRLSRQFCQTMDRLLAEDIGPEQLIADHVIGIVGEQAEHWVEATKLFLKVQGAWLGELERNEEIDGPSRRNRLFDHAARQWRANPPATAIVAAGVTSAAPALARLLRVVSELPEGAVILPDMDLALDDAVWDELGAAGVAIGADGSPFGFADAVTHPQYHLKLLLNRMGISRHEVRPWHRAGMVASPPERSRTISNLFLPSKASASWVDLPAEHRRMSGVKLIEAATPEEEAQAIALLVREALEQPEKRVAVVTPDRGLATRISAHLRRWNIEADDSAGRPLSQTPAGRVLLLLAEIIGERAAPIPLLALLEHPLVKAGEERAVWLERVRALELMLRGPRPAAGLGPLAEVIARLARRDDGAEAWWASIVDVLSPLLALAESEAVPLSLQMEALARAGEELCGPELWGREDGRALSAMAMDLRSHAEAVGTVLAPADLAASLRDAMDMIAVRPPYGGHPRVAIYGLLEARMSRADLVVCGGLNEGVWPANPASDPVLPPAVLRVLGVPGADFRIGLSAHDLAGALGAPEVVLSRARRDLQGPAIPSRFLLRVRALLGEDLLARHIDANSPELARAMDDGVPAAPYPRPQPSPAPEQRKVEISVTALDRLRSDPYQFYAQAILRLRPLDPLDAEPSAAWKGTATHEILKRWHERGGSLRAIALETLTELNAHPLMRSLWQPRLLAALEWVEAEMERRGLGRPIAFEADGSMDVRGIRIYGRVDRIDALPGGELAIVDYKTGRPPSAREVENGFALQLGTLGLMARSKAFAGVSGEPTHFEYWSLAKNPKSETGFGFVEEPVLEGRRKSGIPREEFLSEAARFLNEALDRWILGDEPFTARLNPDVPGYADYDQLMRLDEWMGRQEDEGR